MGSSLRVRLVSLPLAALVVCVAVAAADRGSADVQVQLGDLLAREARFAEAADAYDRAWAVAEGPLRARAGKGLLRSLIRVGEARRARELAPIVVRLSSGDSEAVALEGDAYWVSGLFDEADLRYRDAIAVGGKTARAWNGRAKSLTGRGRFEEALDAATTAVGASPAESEFHHTLGFVQERLGRYEMAAASYSSYINLLPNRDRSDKALWARQQVRFLRSFEGRRPIEIEDDAPDRVHTVPFRIVRDKIVVEGRINGGRAIDFVLDTGSELTSVTVEVAARSGVKPVVYTISAGVGQSGLRGLQLGRMNSLRIGSLRVRHVPTLIKNPPLKDLPTREAETFSPLAFGLSVSVDYARRILTIARRLPPTLADIELPLWTHRLAMVRGVINGDSPAHFVVDTGGEVISLSRAKVDELQNLRPTRRIPLKVYGASGWDPDAFLLPGVDLAFRDISLSNLPVVVLNLDAPSVLLGFEVGGIVGHRFLKDYVVGFDLQRSVLTLKKL